MNPPPFPKLGADMNRLTYLIAISLLLDLTVAKAVAADSDFIWKFGSDARISQTDSHVDATIDPTVENSTCIYPPTTTAHRPLD